MKRLCGTKSVNAAAIVSMCWRALSPEEKALYHKMAADDKFRYYKEKGEYERGLKRTKVEAKEHNSLNATWDGKGPGLSGPLRPCKSSSLFAHRESGSAKCSLVAMLQEQRSSRGEEQRRAIVVPPYSGESIAHLASKLDASSIDFLIKALK